MITIGAPGLRWGLWMTWSEEADGSSWCTENHEPFLLNCIVDAYYAATETTHARRHSQPPFLRIAPRPYIPTSKGELVSLCDPTPMSAIKCEMQLVLASDRQGHTEGVRYAAGVDSLGGDAGPGPASDVAVEAVLEFARRPPRGAGRELEPDEALLNPHALAMLRQALARVQILVTEGRNDLALRALEETWMHAGLLRQEKET